MSLKGERFYYGSKKTLKTVYNISKNSGQNKAESLEYHNLQQRLLFLTFVKADVQLDQEELQPSSSNLKNE